MPRYNEPPLHSEMEVVSDDECEHRDNEPVTVTALAFDPETRDWTKPVSYQARNRMEAIRWQNFNKDWFKGFRITSP